MREWVSPDGRMRLIHGDCMDLMATLPDSSINAIITDPPYFKVVDDTWDHAWDSRKEFLQWLAGIADEWKRVLISNGSLWCFAYPDVSAHIEVMLSERFNVLNEIVWKKNTGRWQKACKEDQRSYFPQTERIVFAEHYGADNWAKGETGYVAKCDELRGFVFEPLRAYLAGERDRSGWTTRRVAEAFQKRTGSRTVTGMAGHWFEQVQWTLPTQANYEWLRELFNRNGREYLRKEYEELRKEYEELRKEYEELRKEYEELRRPFDCSQYKYTTDVWEYSAEPADANGRHPCQKPLALMGQIVGSSTRRDDLILDCFVGSGSTAVAAYQAGRRFIGAELDADYFNAAVARIEKAMQQPQFEFTRAQPKPRATEQDLL
jgi:adenine-specific DNA-methyltransferase